MQMTFFYDLTMTINDLNMSYEINNHTFRPIAILEKNVQYVFACYFDNFK